MKPRVLHIIDSLNIGGAERVLISLANILKSLQVDVSILVLTDKLDLLPYLDARIPVLRLNRKFKWSIRKLYEVHRICMRFDLVQVHLRYNLRYIGLAKFIFKGKYQVLLHDHYGDIEKDKSVPLGLPFFMSRAWYVGVHPALTQWAQDHVHIAQQRTFILPNTIIRNQEAASPILNVISEKLRMNLVLVSNFRPSKNQEFAVKLMAHLVDTHQLQLELIGQINDSSYLEMIQQGIYQSNLTGSIKINHHVKDIQPILYQYQLAIHTASMESGPLVLLEYLALGLPFVAFKTGQVADELSHSFPEFFVDTFELKAWSSRIKSVLSMDLPTLQQRMIKHFDQHYSPQVYGKKCLEIYDVILKSKEQIVKA